MSANVRSRSMLAFGGLAFILAGEAVAAAPSGSFEEVAERASAAPELEALVAPFLDDCAKARREIDRARCRGMQAFVQSELPNRIYTRVVDSPKVVNVSAYDAGIKGFRIRVIGCLTCEKPVLGPDSQKRYVTLKTPDRNAQSLGLASSLADTTVSFDSVPAARAWEARVKPQLRAEVVFKPTGQPWTYRDYKGVAFVPLATRIFDRCTGEVVFSSPPSQGKAPVFEDTDGCPSAPEIASKSEKEGSLQAGEEKGLADSTSGRNKEGLDTRPDKLGASEIAQALRPVNAALRACDARFKTRGSVDLEFEVQGRGGTAQTVRAHGALGGTEVANCLLDAVRKVQFPEFQRANQKFSFSVRLYGE